MEVRQYPSWGKDQGKDIGGGWVPPLNKVRQYDKVGPIDFDIISHRLYSIINEGRQAVQRISGCPTVAEAGEAGFFVNDPYGSTSSMACGLVLHTIGSEGYVREIMELQSDCPGIFDGDMFMFNEPSLGGTHSMDQWTGTPIFHEGELICWLGDLTHTGETGAIDPGGTGARARSLLHEGYRVQGIKIQEKGKINRASLNCVTRSSRDPAYYTLDLRARMAGLNVAKRRIKELIARYGVEKVKAVIQQNMDYTEELARAKLRTLADGTWRAVNYCDWDLGPRPKLWKVVLTATKVGDELTLDFTGSSPANEGSANCMLPGTWGNSFGAIIGQLFWEVPGNAGIIRPVRLVAPEGSVVNPPFLTACSLCPSCPGFLIANVVHLVIARMLYTNEKYWGDINAPWRALTWHGDHWAGMTQHGYYSAGALHEQWAKGTGAGIDEGRGDGCDTGADQISLAASIPDAEMNELMYPILYLWRREELDTAAPGRWRGGAGYNSAVTPHNTPSLSLGFSGQGKYSTGSQSLDGAYPSSFGNSGPAAIIRLNGLRDAFARGEKPSNMEDVRDHVEKKGGEFKWAEPRQSHQQVGPDDISLNLISGGMGVGDPLDREPERVLADFERRIFTLKMAREVFGVVIDAESRTVDEKATEARRKDIRAKRKKIGKIWEG